MELEKALRTAAKMGAIEALTQAGLMGGEITFPKARKQFGKWFTDAVERGDITPSRVGGGNKRAFNYYSLNDILAKRTEQEIKASIII